jgi:hypothetical protein
MLTRRQMMQTMAAIATASVFTESQPVSTGQVGRIGIPGPTGPKGPPGIPGPCGPGCGASEGCSDRCAYRRYLRQRCTDAIALDHVLPLRVISPHSPHGKL